MLKNGFLDDFLIVIIVSYFFVLNLSIQFSISIFFLRGDVQGIDNIASKFSFLLYKKFIACFHESISLLLSVDNFFGLKKGTSAP